jgi:hypothetical protein
MFIVIRLLNFILILLILSFLLKNIFITEVLALSTNEAYLIYLKVKLKIINELRKFRTEINHILKYILNKKYNNLIRI